MTFKNSIEMNVNHSSFYLFFGPLMIFEPLLSF